MANDKSDRELLARALRVILEEVVKEARVGDQRFGDRINERVLERIRQAQIVASNIAGSADRSDLSRMRDCATDIVREVFRKP